MAQKRNLLYLMLISLLCCFLVVGVAGCGISDEVSADQSLGPLETAFAAGGGEFAKWYLAGWGNLSQAELTIDELAVLGKEVCKGLGIEITGNTSQQTGNSTTILYTGIKGANQYEVLLQQLPTETYLIVNIDSSSGEGEMGKEENLLREVLLTYTAEPDISAMIKGYLPGKYTERKGKKILTKMIEGASGIVVERTIESGYMSFTGFTERVEKSVLVGVQKVNLQCALSYDEIQGKTLVLLATPLIFAEY